MNSLISVLGCRKCGRCNSVCDAGAIERIDGYTRINQEKCNVCKRCVVMCPNKALKLVDI